MAAGFPVKQNYATGDVLTAANMNDLSETLNYLDPTAKGDLFPASSATALTRLAVGANDTVLTADSSTATGLKWATASSGGMTLLSTTTLTGASVTVSSIPSTYKELRIFVQNFSPSTDAENLLMRVNSDSGSNYASTNTISNTSLTKAAQTFFFLSAGADNAVTSSTMAISLPNYANTAAVKQFSSDSFVTNSTTTSNWNMQRYVGAWNDTSAISSLTFLCGTGNLSTGTVLLYGVS
jgi:hypothetical protein